MKTPDQREHIRYEVKWEVEVSAAEWDDVLTLTTTSVSQGGLFIGTSRPPDVGTSVAVSLTLPDENVVKMEGDVVRTVAQDDPQPGFALRLDPERCSDLVLLESMASAFGAPEDSDPKKRGSSITASVVTHEVRAEEAAIQFGDQPPQKPTKVERPKRKSSPSLSGVPAFELVDADNPKAFASQPTVPRPPSTEHLKAVGGKTDKPASEKKPADKPEPEKPKTEKPKTEKPKTEKPEPDRPEAPPNQSRNSGSYDVGDQLLAVGEIVEAPVSEEITSHTEEEWPDQEKKNKEKKQIERKKEAKEAKEEQDDDSALPPLDEADPDDDMIVITEGPAEGEAADGEVKVKVSRHDRPTMEAPITSVTPTLEVAAAPVDIVTTRPVVKHSLPPLTKRRGSDEAAAFGVDFGTSYTSIGLFFDGDVAVLEDAEGYPLVPTAVSYPEQGIPLIGWAAREQLASQPSTTFMSPKRLIGRQYDDPAVEPLLAQSAVRFDRGPAGQIVADIYGHPVTMIQVATEVFRHMAQIAETRSGRPISKVVLGAPVSFEEAQRSAITRAAKLAGLEVVGIVDEPVAAAIASGATGEEEKLVAIYDFGGGTFDFTILKSGGGNFEVMGEAGDAWLGGDDFDLALANHVADQFEKQKKIDLRKRQVEWQRLLFICERAKRQLTNQEETVIESSGMALSLKGSIDLKVGVNRTLFNELCRELIDRSMETVETCLMLTGHDPEEVDQVVMTGGVSRIPMVRERVQQFFGRQLELSLNPEEAICVGAARFARQAAGVYVEE